jgi:fatty acid omega-hydroxylase
VLVRFLRLQSSVQFFPSRTALADIDIAGTTIPKGAPIFLMYGAGNQDPWRFPDANGFDPERKDNEHIGWGRGIHVCFGGPRHLVIDVDVIHDKETT